MYRIHHPLIHKPTVWTRCLSTIPYPSLYTKFEKEIESVREYKAREYLTKFLRTQSSSSLHEPPPLSDSKLKHKMTSEEIRTALDASLATFHLHIESRVAAVCGVGYYTIGPCGEEMLAPIAHCLKQEDALALHYRHLSISILRALNSGKSMEEVLLDRARGYVVSTKDPVTGGVHCALGGGKNDYVVTSTLASQCPPAVGRALGFSIAQKIQTSDKKTKRKKPVSFVTLGDGSANHSHFLSALNLAKHARYRRMKCPVVFGISDNGLSISYKQFGYLDEVFSSYDSSYPLLRIFHADGQDMFDIYDKTHSAIQYSRTYSTPSLILYKNLLRRFGHAATDRQFAYLDPEEIEALADSCVLTQNIESIVESASADMSYFDIYTRFMELEDMTRRAFDMALRDEKITSRKQMMDRVSQPLVSIPPLPHDILCRDVSEPKRGKTEVMRKHMNRVISESLHSEPEMMYIGEDVEHGGYYLVTENLAKRYPGRVCDFPPDETTLIGAAIGYSQLGLTPIIEIPYAKYLDCGADMFYEACISNWLTNGKCPNGMIIRLQGFDRGTFGGNFHTHNSLCIPPGIDVVCFSNGEDYVRGFRNAVMQAKNGRIVMIVDSTFLLNLRHLYDKDRKWERVYPKEGELMGFHDVIRYGTKGDIAVVTYGNGVVTSLQARKALANEINEESIDIIDCPYISDVSDGLRNIIPNYKYVIFADVCKDGQSPLSGIIMQLHKEKLLTMPWKHVAAPRTYNPLGNTLTFLSVEDVMEAIRDRDSYDNF